MSAASIDNTPKLWVWCIQQHAVILSLEEIMLNNGLVIL